MSVLFIDTETTGKWDFKAPADDPRQPHLVQLAAILDEGGDDTKEFETLIQVPNGVKIEEGALRTHGITLARANAEGMSPMQALTILDNMIRLSGRIVCHNTDFDLRVLTAAYKRAGVICTIPRVESYCTMRQAENVCRLPGRFGKYKWPTLDEAYRILVNEGGFEGAHNALADVRACRAVYYALLSREQQKEEPRQQPST